MGYSAALEFLPGLLALPEPAFSHDLRQTCGLKVFERSNAMRHLFRATHVENLARKIDVDVTRQVSP